MFRVLCSTGCHVRLIFLLHHLFLCLLPFCFFSTLQITFEPHQAYAIDIVMSTGEGKAKELDSRTTVFKRDPEAHYLLKMKASRYERMHERRGRRKFYD